MPHPSTVTLNSQRLVIRPFQKGDEIAVLNLIRANQDHLAKVLPEWVKQIDTVEEAKAFVKRMRMGWLLKKVLAFGFWEGEQLLGEVLLFDFQGNQAEIGYFIDRGHQGKGFTGEAFKAVVKFVRDHQTVPQLVALCPPWHIASRKVAEQAGFSLWREDEAYATYRLEVGP